MYQIGEDRVACCVLFGITTGRSQKSNQSWRNSCLYHFPSVVYSFRKPYTTPRTIPDRSAKLLYVQRLLRMSCCQTKFPKRLSEWTLKKPIAMSMKKRKVRCPALRFFLGPILSCFLRLRSFYFYASTDRDQSGKYRESCWYSLRFLSFRIESNGNLAQFTVFASMQRAQVMLGNRLMPLSGQIVNLFDQWTCTFDRVWDHLTCMWTFHTNSLLHGFMFLMHTNNYGTLA